MEYFRRKSPRIPKFDYTSPNYYFITICTHEKKCIFANGKKLNTFGEYAAAYMENIEKIHSHIKIDKYVIMPNHVHCILIADEKNGQNVSTVIGQYKMSVTKEIRKSRPNMQVWQRSFYDHIIRSQMGYEKIWNYIDQNPEKWEDDCFYSEA